MGWKGRTLRPMEASYLPLDDDPAVAFLTVHSHFCCGEAAQGALGLTFLEHGSEREEGITGRHGVLEESQEALH